MNMSYRMNFALRMLLPLFLFSSYFFFFTVTIDVNYCCPCHDTGHYLWSRDPSEGDWGKINLQHDQRTRENAKRWQYRILAYDRRARYWFAPYPEISYLNVLSKFNWLYNPAYNRFKVDNRRLLE